MRFFSRILTILRLAGWRLAVLEPTHTKIDTRRPITPALPAKAVALPDIPGRSWSRLIPSGIRPGALSKTISTGAPCLMA